MANTLITYPEANIGTDNIIQNKIFIGEWCETANIDQGKIVKYNFRNDYNQLKKNKEYLDKTFKIFINILTISLNKFHSTKFDEKFWTIAIGPYLRTMLHIIFERNELINKTINQFDIDYFLKINLNNEKFIPVDSRTIDNKYVNEHFWNNKIFFQLIKQHKNIKIKNEYTNFSLEVKKNFNIKKNKNFLSLKKLPKIFFEKITHFYTFFTFLILPKSILKMLKPTLFFDKNIPNKQIFLMCIKGKKFPWNFKKIFETVKDIFPISRSSQSRKLLLSTTNQKNLNDLEKIMLDIIIENLPISFLENFEKIRENFKLGTFPPRTNCIVARSWDYQPDFIKLYAAEQVSLGSKLHILQSRSGPGIVGNFSYEEFDRQISDQYFTWGWSDNKDKKVSPYGSFAKKDKEKFEYNKNGINLLITYRLDDYSLMYDIDVPRSGDWYDYNRDLIFLYKNFNKIQKKKTVIRPRPSRFENRQRQLWDKELKDYNIDTKSNFTDLIKSSRICVSTYADSHTYLETFHWNIPTMIYFNQSLYKLRDSAKPYFERMRKLGIFYDDPLKLSKNLEKNWENISEWWFQDDIQNFRKEFCNTFFKKPNDISKLVKTN